MIYLVTNQQFIIEYSAYKIITVQESLNLLETLSIVGVDTETQGFDPYTKNLLLLQLGNYDFQIVIDCTSIDPKLYKPFLESERLFLFWNAKFDLKFLYHHGIIVKNVFDGYLAEKLLWLGYPSGEHSMSLKSAGEEYCGIELDKTVRGKIHYGGLSDEVIIYSANDVKYLERIMILQKEKLEKEELLLAIEIENEFVRVLAYIEYCGIKLDPVKWAIKMKKDLEDLQKAELKLNKWIEEYYPQDKRFCTINLQGDLFLGFDTAPKCSINWNSSKQVIPLLEELGFDLWTLDKVTKQPKKSIDAKIIEPQKGKSDIAPVYLDFKAAQKVVSTYGQSVLNQINPVTNRIHTNFNQLMDTGRLSCGGKNKQTKEDYINLQNLPNNAETRESFIAQEGYSLIDCDYSGQEDYVFTELSREPKLVAFYNDTKKRDGHSFTAKICFPKELNDVPEEDVKSKRPDLRSRAKTAKFALHYGGNGTTVARNLGLSEEDGLRIEKAYFNGFTGIDYYFKKVKKQTMEKGYILLNPIVKTKSYIHDWERLKETAKEFTSDFWNEYRSIKEDKNHPMVKKVKWYFKRKAAIDRTAMNYPKCMGRNIVIY